jgi:hypothetical protein
MILVCKKEIIFAKSREMNIGCNLSESSKAGYGSKRAVLQMIDADGLHSFQLSQVLLMFLIHRRYLTLKVRAKVKFTKQKKKKKSPELHFSYTSNL